MSASNEIDYSQFGGTPEEDIEKEENQVDYSQFGGTAQEQPSEVDYSQYGGEEEKPDKEKAGSFKSALLGISEGVLSPKAIIEDVQNYTAKQVFKLLGIKTSEPRNLPKEIMSEFPESKDEAARRYRVAGQALPGSALFGIPGIISGIIGSQAGQTVREVYGKDGKFEKFGWGEAAAIFTDVIFGFGTQIGANLLKTGTKHIAQKTPVIFSKPGTSLQKKAVQVALKQEENALNSVIENFSKKQLQEFEEVAESITSRNYTELANSNASALKAETESMARNTQLDIISPLQTTPEQGGRAIQESANSVFRNEVLAAERTAYKIASEAANDLSGSAPKALSEAKQLRSSMTKNAPTPEQKPVIVWLDNLIDTLETTTPAKTTPASMLLDASGNPIKPATTTKSVTQATTKKANDLVDLVQKSNQVVNYGGELRYQADRLKPVIRTLRDETHQVLSKDPKAATAYRDANTLHARNAQVWGTKYMRNVRFNENPETIIGQTQKASNMRNLKEAIPDPIIQGLAERQVVENLTKGERVQSSRIALRNLSPELSPVAQGSAEELMSLKDQLTTQGGRAAVKNQILKDTAKSVNTGSRPKSTLKLMETRKGYQIVKETLNGSSESRELFKTLEKQFVNDILKSVTSETGVIDFKKATDIFKNPEIKGVIGQIGDGSIIRKFNQLEKFSKNFEKNLSLYSKPETQSLIKTLTKEAVGTGWLAVALHSFHMPWPVIAGLGLAKTGVKVSRITYKSLEKKLLSNPRALHYLEQVSNATTTKELAKQLPRLIKELNKGEED